jgi:Fe-S-cluster containining protein
MDIDFTPFFNKYESLVAMAEGVFERVKKEYPDLVKCQIGCCDCCNALFDITLIEAIYLNHHFNKKFKGKARGPLVEKANKTDRKLYKIKRKAHQDSQKGVDENEILSEMALERVRCPLLNDEEMCDLYEFRPITCRVYGVPTSIAGRGHTCGKSGFVEGNKYPTVNIDIVYKHLYDISNELVKAIKSSHTKMGDMLVPVSMAMTTNYDEAYLGLADKEKNDAKEGKADG